MRLGRVNNHAATARCPQDVRTPRNQAAAHRPAASVVVTYVLSSVHLGCGPEPGDRFLRAPLACWWARTVVKSTSSVSRAASSCTDSNMRCHTLEAAQRWKRVYVICQSPCSFSKARQRAPLRASQHTASTDWLLSRPRPSLVSGRPGSSGANRAHCASVNSYSISQANHS